MIVVTFLNRKGGVGKTSSVFHLSTALARKGQRVLLIDNDPQASLTQGFVGPQGLRAIPSEKSIVTLYDPATSPLPERLLFPTGFESVTLIPGSEQLDDLNITPKKSWAEFQNGLREFLRDIRGEFDLVLIDCPPNLYLCSWAALLASDRIVIPVQAEDFGSQGLTPVRRAIAEVQKRGNPSLRLLGYLLTMYDGRKQDVHDLFESELRKSFDGDVFAARIPESKDYVEAVVRRHPVRDYKPRSAAAKAITAVADELLGRIGLVVERGAA